MFERFFDDPWLKVRVAIYLLRFGLAFVFLFVTIEAVLNPDLYYKYIPAGVEMIIPLPYFMYLLSVGELILVLWFLWGRQVRYAAIIAALFLISVVGFNPGEFNILFRNVAIIFGALALAVLS